MDEHVPGFATSAVNGRSEGILFDIIWNVGKGQITDFDGCLRLIDETPSCDTLAAGFDLDEQLSIVEQHADDYGIEFEGVSLDRLRATIEEHATAIVSDLAMLRARAAIEDLREFMTEHDFALEDLKDANDFAWARHYAERSEGDRCQVYEYRNVEGEIHVDVWEYVLTARTRVYLQRHIAPDEVSVEEVLFEAS